MGLDNLLNYGQTQPRAGFPGGRAHARLLETLKKQLLLARRHALTMISNSHHGLAVLDPERDLYAPALGRKLHGVGQQVVQHLADPPGVERKFRNIVEA